MKTIEIETLHDRAARLYVAGSYREAKRVWEEVLSVAPADKRAAEGVQMIEILSLRRQGAGGGEAPVGGGTEREGFPAEEMERIEDLLKSEQYKEAMKASKALLASYPQEVEARKIADKARKKFEAEPFVSGELDRAKRAWQSGDLSEVRAACRRVLSIDSSHPMASELAKAAEESSSQTVVPAADLRAPRGSEPSPTGVRAASESAAGSLFEMGDATDEPIGLGQSGLRSEGGALFKSPFERPDAETPEAANFSELEEEIDETLRVMDSRAAAAIGGAEAGLVKDLNPPLPETVADDLAFAEQAPQAQSADGAGATASAGSRAVDPRMAALLGEARSQIRAGRYSEAIESASRAFAIDTDAPGAQELIDESRALLDEVDRQSEEHLYNAQKFLEEGDSDAAEALLRDVLRTHPAHREAIDLLSRITRQRESPGRDAEPPAVAISTGSTGSTGPTGPTGPTIAVERDPSRSPSPASTVRVDLAAAPASLDPFLPRPHGSDIIPPPAPVASDAGAAEALASPAPSRRFAYRVLLYASIVVVLSGIAALGLIVLPRLIIGKEETAPPAPITPHVATRKRTVNASKPVSQPPAPEPSPAEKDPAEGLPRTYEQARSLAGEGKLQEARAVLKDFINKEPGNRPAIELLGSVGERLREREQRERSFASIETAFKQERYEDALRMLYRLPQPTEGVDVERYKRNAWYNNALQYMMGGNITETIRCLKEAADIDPADPDVRRLMGYAREYQGKEKDGVYFRYVETIPKRTIDAR